MILSKRNLQILIAEDDGAINELIRLQLVRLGHTVIGSVYNGPDAVKSACRFRPHLVLMDLQMPDPETGEDDLLAGLEAAQAIQAECPIPVVLLTAHESADLVQQASTAGVGAYLLKPVQDNDLERAILIALARFDDLQTLRRLNAELQEALAQVKRLKGLLPICANCKKIRDDHGYWQQVEVYIRDHSEADFTSGICPDCLHQLYPRELYPYLYDQ